MRAADTSTSEEFRGLREARAPTAAGPRPDTESLRGAYLDVLKLALCDLAGAGTTSVGKWEDGSVRSRELSGAALRVRAAGMDWPLHGLTMVGLNRLDDLQACVESVVADGVEGDLIEAGCWRGGASILMRAALDALEGPGRTVWVADSFQGFPAEDRQVGLSAADFLAVGQDAVEANFARFGLTEGVRFVPGFFEDTLPALAGGRWAVVRLDGDTYEATRVALDSLYPGLAVGGHVVIDDFGALPECRRAVEDYRREHGVDEPLVDVDWTCARWRKEREVPAAGDRRALRPPAARTVRPVGRAAPRPVPTEREVALGEEVAELRRQLAAGASGRAGARLRRWLARRGATR
jgi:O-methyltransferase